MFGKSNSTEDTETKAYGTGQQEQRPAVPAPQGGAVQHSIIGPSTTLTGDLEGTGDITIEGTVEGNIKCRVLTLSGEPRINGSVEADVVHVCGTFIGDVRASKVVLGKMANMTGRITYEIFEVHPGARFEGKVGRSNAQQSKAAKAPASKKRDRPEDPDPPIQPAA
jgi:cytoskeletal protein CcmA (bactofilin family)